MARPKVYGRSRERTAISSWSGGQWKQRVSFRMLPGKMFKLMLGVSDNGVLHRKQRKTEAF